MTVITPDRIQSSPLTTAIAPLPGNTTTTATTTFSFTANCGYAPTAPPVQQIYYQVDTQNGPWRRATPDGASGSGDTSPLPSGVHLLFAFSTDGQEATSINTGSGSSPILGNVSAYLFLVVQGKAELSLTLFQDPADGATEVKAEVGRVFNPADGQDLALQRHDFQVQLTYDGSCIDVLDVRGDGFDITDIKIDQAGGVTTFKVTTPTGVTAPADLVFVLTRLRLPAFSKCRQCAARWNIR